MRPIILFIMLWLGISANAQEKRFEYFHWSKLFPTASASIGDSLILFGGSLRLDNDQTEVPAVWLADTLGRVHWYKKVDQDFYFEAKVTDISALNDSTWMVKFFDFQCDIGLYSMVTFNLRDTSFSFDRILWRGSQFLNNGNGQIFLNSDYNTFILDDKLSLIDSIKTNGRLLWASGRFLLAQNIQSVDLLNTSGNILKKIVLNERNDYSDFEQHYLPGKLKFYRVSYASPEVKTFLEEWVVDTVNFSVSLKREVQIQNGYENLFIIENKVYCFYKNYADNSTKLVEYGDDWNFPKTVFENSENEKFPSLVPVQIGSSLWVAVSNILTTNSNQGQAVSHPEKFWLKKWQDSSAAVPMVDLKIENVDLDSLSFVPYISHFYYSCILGIGNAFLKITNAGSQPIKNFSITTASNKCRAFWCPFQPTNFTRQINKVLNPGETTIIVMDSLIYSAPKDTPTGSICFFAYADDGLPESNPEDNVFCTAPSTQIFTGIRESQPLSGYKLYPNPSTGTTTLSAPDAVAKQAWLRDVSGRLLQYFDWPNESEHTFEVSNLPAGYYLLEIQTQDGRRGWLKLVRGR